MMPNVLLGYEIGLLAEYDRIADNLRGVVAAFAVKHASHVHARFWAALRSLNLLAVLCLVQSFESLKIDISSCWISGVDMDPCRERERQV